VQYGAIEEGEEQGGEGNGNGENGCGEEMGRSPGKGGGAKRRCPERSMSLFDRRSRIRNE